MRLPPFLPSPSLSVWALSKPRLLFGGVVVPQTQGEVMVTEETPKGSLIDQVRADLNKAERESVKAKLKENLKKRNEHEKAIRLIDAENTKIITEFEAGL